MEAGSHRWLVTQCIWEKNSEREGTSVVQRTDAVSSESSSSQNKPCVPVSSICTWPESLLGRVTERVKGGVLPTWKDSSPSCPVSVSVGGGDGGVEVRRASAGPSHCSSDRGKSPSKGPRGLVTGHTEWVQQTGRGCVLKHAWGLRLGCCPVQLPAWKAQAQISQDRARCHPETHGWHQPCHVETGIPSDEGSCCPGPAAGPVGSCAQHCQVSHF